MGIMKCIERFTYFCVANDIVSEERASWFQYGIERRLINILIGIPFFALALILTTFRTSVAFYFSFYFLRCRINGYHAKSVYGCFIISLLCESIFLSVFYHMLSPTVLLLVNTVAIVLIFLLAPFKDSSFALSHHEYIAVKNSSRIRVSILAATTYILILFKMNESAKGVTAGIAMAVFLLGLAYIKNGGKTYEQTAKQSTESPKHFGIKND